MVLDISNDEACCQLEIIGQAKQAIWSAINAELAKLPGKNLDGISVQMVREFKDSFHDCIGDLFYEAEKEMCDSIYRSSGNYDQTLIDENQKIDADRNSLPEHRTHGNYGAAGLVRVARGYEPEQKKMLCDMANLMEAHRDLVKDLEINSVSGNLFTAILRSERNRDGKLPHYFASLQQHHLACLNLKRVLVSATA